MWKILGFATLFGVFVPTISAQNWDPNKMRQCLCLTDITGTFSASVPDNIMREGDASTYWYTETMDGQGDFYNIKLSQAYRCSTVGSQGVMNVSMTFGGELTRYSLSCLADTQTQGDPAFTSTSNYHFMLDVNTGDVTVTSVSFSESFYDPNQGTQNTGPIGNSGDTTPINTVNFNMQLTMDMKYGFFIEPELSSQISGLMRKGLSAYWVAVKNCMGN